MKRISFLAVFLAAAALLSTSCGTSDSVKSLTLGSNGASAGGFYNLVGVDGTIQLTVTANYNSGRTVDVTNQAVFTMTPTGTDQNGADLPSPGPSSVTISPTGMMTGVAPICTWEDLVVTTGTTTGPANPPIWVYTGYYQTTATYKGLTSQPVGIGVGSATSKNSPTGGCGPS